VDDPKEENQPRSVIAKICVGFGIICLGVGLFFGFIDVGPAKTYGDIYKCGSLLLSEKWGSNSGTIEQALAENINIECDSLRSPNLTPTIIFVILGLLLLVFAFITFRKNETKAAIIS
jgi:hypothetical protein